MLAFKVSLSIKVLSSGIFPIALRITVCANWVTAIMTLSLPYDAFSASITYKLTYKSCSYSKTPNSEYKDMRKRKEHQGKAPQYLHKENTIHSDANIVCCNSRLLRDFYSLLFQWVYIGYSVNKRYQEVQTSFKNLAELPKTLNDICLLLRHKPNTPVDSRPPPIPIEIIKYLSNTTYN